MTSIAGHFLFYLPQKLYFLSLSVVVVVAFLSFEQQAFLSAQQAFLSFEQQAFLSVAVHSFFTVFLLSSLVVEAFTVETAKPIVKANAKIIANFFIISNFK